MLKIRGTRQMQLSLRQVENDYSTCCGARNTKRMQDAAYLFQSSAILGRIADAYQSTTASMQ